MEFIFDKIENIVVKGENHCGKRISWLLLIHMYSAKIKSTHFIIPNIFLYTRRRQDILWDHPWRVGGQRPVLCPEHISKTVLAMVMKFCGWIDLIKGDCSAYCYVHTQLFLALYMCVFIFGFPCGYF